MKDHYRIERELGAGGMATVYLAEDLRHQRRVAIKFLKPELAAVIGAERFLSEIRTTASLQHPHILPLFDSGEDDGQLFYVMPYVEGISLREKLKREKQLPIADAVRITREVASALDYAHRRGIIHRDIKPENIMLHDGSALVMDFGIALAASKAGTRMTETGMSLGTPQYMSPEQAMGERELDARSDVYALGCVAYEMLTGEAPFSGPTAQAIVAKVMTSEPVEITTLRRTIPPSVAGAVHRALEKLPADRFESASAFAAALAPDAPVVTRSGAHAAGRATRRGLLPWVFAAGAAVGLAAVAFVAGRAMARGGSGDTVPSRLAILAPSLGGSGMSALTRNLAITPDGEAIIYSGMSSTVSVGLANSLVSLWYRRLDALEAIEIPGSQGMAEAAISWDGSTIAGVALTGVYRLPVSGGVPRRMPVRAGSTFDGMWSPDGSYWFSYTSANGIARVSPDDSVIGLPRGRTDDLRMQQVFRDGRTALVIRAPLGTVSGPVQLLDLETGQSTPLFDQPVIEARLAFGELIVAMPNGALVAMPFDLDGRRATGPATQLAAGVMQTGNGIAQFAVAENGTIAWIPETPRSLVRIRRDGTMSTLVGDQVNIHAPRFSPDGSRISFDITTSDGRDVWVWSIERHTLTRATFDRDGHDAVWTPDGRFLTYSSLRNGVMTLIRSRPGATTPPDTLLASPQLTYPGTWLRDGRTLITLANDLRGTSGGDVARFVVGDTTLQPVVASSFEEGFAVPSPDGRWLAYSSNQSGSQEVYVRDLAGAEEPIQVSQGGGSEPMWSRDGNELFYRTLGNRIELMVVSLRRSPTLGVLGQRALFSLEEMVAAQPHSNYDVAPDGQSFIMVKRSPSGHIMVLQNAPALLRRLRSGSPGAR